MAGLIQDLLMQGAKVQADVDKEVSRAPQSLIALALLTSRMNSFMTALLPCEGILLPASYRHSLPSQAGQNLIQAPVILHHGFINAPS